MARSKKPQKTKNNPVPSREQILQFLSENPASTGKREIARAFGIKGAAKIELKAELKRLAEEGLIEKHGKKLLRAGDLPRVAVLDIVARNRDGGLLARPVAWDEATDGKPPAISIRQPKGNKAVTAGVGDRVLARTEKSADDKGAAAYSARVMKRLERKRDALLGVLRIDGNNVRLEPTNRRQEEIVLEKDSIGEAQNGDLVEVEVSGSRKYGLKRGRVTQIVGNMASETAVSMIAIHANGIPHIFPEEALNAAKSTKPLRSGEKGSKHEDWRSLPLITIDPATAKDHDDAVHAEPDEAVEGGHVVTVAIADVSWYVRPDTAMDREALKRGNSVYFPDRVVPMLPERISNDLCSLRENEDRPALAVRMWFDANGRKTRHKFHRVLMKSHAKLAYEQAQAAIDGRCDEQTAPLLATVLEPLWQAWRCMLRGREARAPLELDLPERRILLRKDGTVDRVIVPDRLDAHKLIEEFMIQANVAAAETLEAKKQRLVYRTHDAPSLDKLESLREFLKSANLSLIRAGNIRASHFNSILESASGEDHEVLVNQVVLRTQSQAAYSPDNIGHFGLNLARYAHFTSPIRRYADLIVHRALVGALGLGEGGLPASQEEILDVIAADISATERRAMNAERETIDRLIAGFLSEKIGERFAGRVNGVTRAGLFVTLNETGADGFVPISKISDEYYLYDESRFAVIGEETNRGFQVGQQVEVRLAEAAPIAGALRFEMLSEGKPFKGIVRSRRTNTKAGFRKTGSKIPGRRSGKRSR